MENKMVLYRTNELSKDHTSDIDRVLMYEIFDRENDRLVKNLLSVYHTKEEKLSQFRLYKKLAFSAENEKQKDYVKGLISSLNKAKGKNFKYALWLYPLDNVQAYTEFYACEDLLPLIFGYETSDTKIISYKDEGTLYLYEDTPQIKKKV